MKSPVEYRKNGSLHVILTPEDDIDAAILAAMAKSAAQNPANLTMRYEDGVAVFEVRG